MLAEYSQLTSNITRGGAHMANWIELNLMLSFDNSLSLIVIVRYGSRTKSHWTKTHRTISKRTKSKEDKNPGGQNPMGTKAQGDNIQVRQNPRRTKTQGDKIQWGQKPMEDNIQADNSQGGQNPKIFPRMMHLWCICLLRPEHTTPPPPPHTHTSTYITLYTFD